MALTTLQRLVIRVWIAGHDAPDERGASLVEYALLVALIAIVCMVAVTFLGQSASSKFATAGSSVGG